MNAVVSSNNSSFYLQKSVDLINIMLKFMKKYFNSTTMRGRANTAKLTYATFALLYLYHRFGKKKPPPSPAELEKLHQQKGGCATFRYKGDTDEDREERGSEKTDASKDEKGSCATFKYSNNGTPQEGVSDGEPVRKESTQADFDENLPSNGVGAEDTVESESDTAKKMLYGPDEDKSMKAAAVAKDKSMGTSAKVAEDIPKVGKSNVDTPNETSKPDSATEENKGAHVNKTLNLNKIEEGTLQNASLSPIIVRTKGLDETNDLKI